MSLVIKGMEVKEVPIKAPGIVFDKDGKKELYVDSKGLKIKKIQVQPSEYKWLYEDGSEYSGKAYKSLNGKPIGEFKKSVLIEKTDEVPLVDIGYFVGCEHTYLLVGSKFKEYVKGLQKRGVALSFKFTIRGLKIYKAVVYYDPTLDRALMRLCQGDLRKLTLDESEDKEIVSPDEKVDSLDLDSLEV